MSTIIVAGFGPGISSSVAEKFGKEGFSVALVARSAERLNEGVKALDAKGIKAKAFPCDVSDPDAIKALVAKVKTDLGSIGAIEWNAYSGAAGDVLTANAAELKSVFDIPIVGLITTVQESLADLKSNRGAVLVTNGGYGLPDPQVDAAGVKFNAMGLSIANAAKHKLVRLLHAKLKPEGIYVGEVMVMGMVKGTAFDSGDATLEPKAIAERFWKMYSARTEISTMFQ